MTEQPDDQFFAELAQQIDPSVRVETVNGDVLIDARGLAVIFALRYLHDSQTTGAERDNNYDARPAIGEAIGYLPPERRAQAVHRLRKLSGRKPKPANIRAIADVLEVAIRAGWRP